MSPYEPEDYWSRVAREIENRGENYVAGNDDPFFRYKRRKFLERFLDPLDFRGRTVLEVGFGPGGNLKHIAARREAARLLGADISQAMLEVASRNLRDSDAIELRKIDGEHLPYPDRSVDLALTVTVLQHNTDARMYESLVRELCRVSRDTVVIMEDIGRSAQPGGEGDWVGRRVEVYESTFAGNGFRLIECRFLNTRISRYWYRGIFAIYRKLIAPRHREGDPIGRVFRFLIGLPLPVTRLLDDLFVERQNLARLVFRRQESPRR